MYIFFGLRLLYIFWRYKKVNIKLLNLRLKLIERSILRKHLHFTFQQPWCCFSVYLGRPCLARYAPRVIFNKLCKDSICLPTRSVTSKSLWNSVSYDFTCWTKIHFNYIKLTNWFQTFEIYNIIKIEIMMQTTTSYTTSTRVRTSRPSLLGLGVLT